MTDEREMRLNETAQLIRLDQLAADACELLTRAGIPHAVIKGVTTARWLYDPPRGYRDVDLLVPFSRIPDAIAALAPIAVAGAGEFGEEASHSQVLIDRSHGAELDLHATLPACWVDPRDTDRIWRVLGAHLQRDEIDGRPLTVLDPPGRCLVLAMHVLASGHGSEQVKEDLRRARTVSTDEQWNQARWRAGQLGLEEAFTAALDFVQGRDVSAVSPEMRLRLEGAPATAVQLARLAAMPRRDAVRLLVRELWPSRGFMLRYDPSSGASGTAMLRARFRRLSTLARSMWRR